MDWTPRLSICNPWLSNVQDYFIVEVRAEDDDLLRKKFAENQTTAREEQKENQAYPGLAITYTGKYSLFHASSSFSISYIPLKEVSKESIYRLFILFNHSHKSASILSLINYAR